MSRRRTVDRTGRTGETDSPSRGVATLARNSTTDLMGEPTVGVARTLLAL
ncbi:hypothetical protein NJ7G_0866 [Natrinema sp. J7-2]|nr:hypothetical protein NJ7G_0866 [Natrinema sp. J7-2]